MSTFEAKVNTSRMKTTMKLEKIITNHTNIWVMKNKVEKTNPTKVKKIITNPTNLKLIMTKMTMKKIITNPTNVTAPVCKLMTLVNRTKCMRICLVMI